LLALKFRQVGTMNKATAVVSKRKSRGERGASVVEFALILPLLLLLLMAIVELGVLFWVNMTMQHAVREGARYAITGRKDLDPNENEEERLRSNAILEKIRVSSLGLYDSVVIEPVTITDPAGTELTGFGGPGQIVVINLDCSWPLLTPLVRPFFDEGTYNFKVSSAMRNENF
jgi:hypothetical protein